MRAAVTPSSAHLSLLQMQMQSKMKLFKTQLFIFTYEGPNTKPQLRAEHKASSKRAIIF